MGKVIPLAPRRRQNEIAKALEHQQCRCIPPPRAAISAEVRTDGLVHMQVPVPTFTLTADEADAWADRLRQLAAWAREVAR